MRRKDEERERARQLRAEGWTLRRIANELGGALSSVSVWVREVNLQVEEQSTSGPSSTPAASPSGLYALCR